MFDLLESLWDKVTSGLLGIILDAILYAVAVVLYYIETALGEALDLVYKMFDVFSGAAPVQYNGSKNYLLNVFFENKTINVLYGGMACIGLALLFIFALISVGRKMFDSTGEKVKLNYGMILTNIFKGALFIIAMTFFMNVMVTATGTLLDSVKGLFDNVKKYENPSSIDFDEEDYANMFRVLDKIANRSMDPGYTNRYNINTCYNEICPDMQTLKATGVFEFDYSGAENSWQYALYQIYMAGDLNRGMSVDVYNQNLSDSILNCMYALKYNTSFKPLSHYERTVVEGEDSNASLGTILLLSSTMNAANNSSYNGTKASITDALRLPFYQGVKDIYNRDTVESAFTIEIGRWDHITALFGLGICLIEFIKITFLCISRIFNMLILYLVAPGFIAVLPLDDGGKLKQWTTSFIIQSFSLFGNYIAIRLLLIIIPIIMGNNLVLFDGAVMNAAAKDIFVVGICITAQRSSAMIAGILADNAGMQTLSTLDTGSGIVSRGQALLGRAAGLGLSAAKGAAKLGMGAAGKGLSGLGAVTGASYVKNKIGDKLGNWGKSMRENFGAIGAYKKGFKSKDEMKQEAADKKDSEEAAIRGKLLGGTLRVNGVNDADGRKDSSTVKPRPTSDISNTNSMRNMGKPNSNDGGKQDNQQGKTDHNNGNNDDGKPKAVEEGFDINY